MKMLQIHSYFFLITLVRGKKTTAMRRLIFPNLDTEPLEVLNATRVSFAPMERKPNEGYVLNDIRIDVNGTRLIVRNRTPRK